MAREVCRTHVSFRKPFGRVVELAEAVSAGEDVICEPPAVLVAQPRPRTYLEDLRARYAELTQAQKDFVATLTPHPDVPGLPSASVQPELLQFGRALKANAHIFGEGDQLALFRNVTLAPHSCDHNAAYYDVPGAGLGRLYAIRALARGELLTISYIGTHGCVQLWPAWQRREYLRRGFGFECHCARCEKDPERPPSARSRELLQGLTRLQRELFCTDPRVFLLRAERHLKACEEASPEDDDRFHMLGAVELMCQFHLRLCQQSEEHLRHAISYLAWKYALIADSASPLEDEGLGGLFRVGAALLEADAEAKTRTVLVRLWEQLGGQLLAVLGASSSEFAALCRAFGQPQGLPSVADILRELAAVQPCAACGTAAVLACQRCKAEVYCSVPCQRSRWSGHKAACAAAARQ